MSVLKRLNVLGQAVDAAEDANDLTKLKELVENLKALLQESKIPAERARNITSIARTRWLHSIACNLTRTLGGTSRSSKKRWFSGASL